MVSTAATGDLENHLQLAEIVNVIVNCECKSNCKCKSFDNDMFNDDWLQCWQK